MQFRRLAFALKVKFMGLNIICSICQLVAYRVVVQHSVKKLWISIENSTFFIYDAISYLQFLSFFEKSFGFN